MVLSFCPTCGMLLQLEVRRAPQEPGSSTQEPGSPKFTAWFRCPTCPYIIRILNKITKNIPLPKKKDLEQEELDIFRRSDCLKSAPKISAICPYCSHEEAHFKEIQTRPDDEPATKYHMCCQCNDVWKLD